MIIRSPQCILLFWITAAQIIALSFLINAFFREFFPLVQKQFGRSFSFHQILGTSLPPGFEDKYKQEYENWVRNATTDPFCQSPRNWEHYLPGDFLRIERADIRDYPQIPTGLSLHRVLYMSLDHNEKPVPATAFVLLPYARKSSSTSFDVIVWAHGTAGIEHHCAPSNQRDLYYDFSGPIAMALRGYAVIAPDYAGLGSDTTFHYLSAPGHAADIAYAVVAARAAFSIGLLSHEWVAIGHSEGGLAAWAVNQREVIKPTGGFRGAVSIAPALQNLRIIRYGIVHGLLARSLFYSSYTLVAIARINKSVDVSDYFSELGLERTRLAATACFLTAETLFSDFSFLDVFKDPSWVDSDWAMAWENKTAVVGNKPLAEPLLVVQGLTDTSVYPEVTQEIFAEHCESQPNTRSHLSLYPNIDHDAIMLTSQFEVFNWISDRFSGKHLPCGCQTQTQMVSSFPMGEAITHPEPLDCLNL